MRDLKQMEPEAASNQFYDVEVVNLLNRVDKEVHGVVGEPWEELKR